MLKRSYYIGAFWILVSCFMSSVNDMIGKMMGIKIGGGESLFFRFFFGAVVFLPIMLIKGRQAFATKNMSVHAMRAALFALAMIPWSYGLIDLPLPIMTAISFTTPLFVVAFAKMFLHENVGSHRMFATIVGFAGILIGSGFSANGANKFVLVALCATAMFATLDIINKRLLCAEEGLIPMMFYSTFWAAVFTAPLLFIDWKTPTIQELAYLAVLGASANLLFLCILRAFQAYEVSALQPLRYFEFVFSCALSVLVFGEWPNMLILFGVALIVPAAIYLGYHELSLRKKVS
ncbi:DMT family transporter [Candidatus Hydrogenosomobacter endosymbioticus]|nr:DMT family transporter [Candidatus Hydrogenosomobacter endosymbioticus]